MLSRVRADVSMRKTKKGAARYTSPLFWGFWRRRGAGERRHDCTALLVERRWWYHYGLLFFSSQCLNFLIFPPDTVFPGTSASSVAAESGIIPKRETVTIL